MPSADRFGGGAQFSPRGILSAIVQYWGDMDTRGQKEGARDLLLPREEVGGATREGKALWERPRDASFQILAFTDL